MTERPAAQRGIPGRVCVVGAARAGVERSERFGRFVRTVCFARPARLALPILLVGSLAVGGAASADERAHPREAAHRQASTTAAPGPATAAAEAADVAAIRAETCRWIDAFRTYDIDALMALYMPDAQVALHGQKKLVGRDAIRAFFAPALAARPEVTFELEIEDIRVHGDLAWLLSKYWYVSRARDGAVLRDAGRSLIVYRRDPTDRTRWKLQVDIDQATPDVAFPPGG